MLLLQVPILYMNVYRASLGRRFCIDFCEDRAVGLLQQTCALCHITCTSMYMYMYSHACIYIFSTQFVNLRNFENVPRNFKLRKAQFVMYMYLPVGQVIHVTALANTTRELLSSLLECWYDPKKTN